MTRKWGFVRLRTADTSDCDRPRHRSGSDERQAFFLGSWSAEHSQPFLDVTVFGNTTLAYFTTPKLPRCAKAGIGCRSRGYALPPEETADVEKSHKIVDVIEAYLADLKESRRDPTAIKVKKAELTQFRLFCRKVYVEQITRGDLIAYRNHLLDAPPKLVNKTILNKLMIVDQLRGPRNQMFREFEVGHPTCPRHRG